MKRILAIKGILAALGSLVLLASLSYLLIFSPKIREIRRLQAEVAAKESAMGDEIRQWVHMANTPGAESHQWEARIREWEERVPDAPETDRLMAEIGRRAVHHGLRDFRLIVPSDIRTGKAGIGETAGFSTTAAPAEAPAQAKTKGFEELRFRLSFLSTYKDMAEFVDGVPRMKRLLSVRSMAVREKEGEMETTLELSAYYRKPK